MVSFKFAFALCALFVLQAQAYPQQEAAGDAALDLIKKVVDVTEKVIDRALVLGIRVSEKLIEIAGSTPAENEKIAKAFFDFTGDLLEKLLDKMEEKANDDAKVGIECVKQYSSEWRQAKVNLVVNFTTCSSQQLTGVVSQIKDILAELQGIQEEGKKAASGINSCEGSLSDNWLCVAKVAKDLVDVAKKIPDVVKADLEKLVAIIKENAKAVGECAKGEVKDFYYNDYIKVMNEVSACFRKK